MRKRSKNDEMRQADRGASWKDSYWPRLEHTELLNKQ